MKLIKEDVLNLTLKDQTGYIFEVPENGFYLVEVVASCRSRWQNAITLRSFFNDDDLAVQFNGKIFPKLNEESGQFDGEVAWNGNNLKGTSKTCAIISKLSKGKQLLEFPIDVHPFLQTIRVFQSEEEIISYLPQNNPPQSGDRRQWIIIILNDLGLKSLNISGSANHRKNTDDENIKLVIDGGIEKNPDPKSHQDWYWCGKVLQGQEKTFNKELNLQPGLHYIELWADKSPKLNSISLELGEAVPSGNQDNDPLKIKEGFNPLYVLKDEAFVKNESMGLEEIKNFLDSQHINKQKSHIAVMQFEGHPASFWIKKAADDYKINPKLLISKLQAEQRLIRGEKSIAPNQNQLDWVMGVGVLDNGKKLPQFKGFSIQLINAAKLFRSYYEEAPSVNFIHSNVDGKPIKVVNAATYALYRYTPHFDGPKLIYNIYVSLFGYGDLGGVISNQSSASNNYGKLAIFSFCFLILAVFLNLMAVPVASSKSNTLRPLFSYHKVTDLGSGWSWVVDMNILSARKPTMNDGLYCGYRFDELYQSESKASLVFQDKVMDSVDLSDPEVVFDISHPDLFYYQPQDIDGDGKKEEFVIADYATCNGDWLKFVRPNFILGKIEKIPRTKQGVQYQNQEDQADFYADIGPHSLKIQTGSLAVRYYNNANFEDLAPGFYTDYYKYDKIERKFVWQSTQKEKYEN